MPHVLLVDDSPDIIEPTRNFLLSNGYDVHIANDGAGTLNHLRRRNFDCILLDVWLPDISGFELCGKIRQVSSTPIIFLTCLDDEQNKIRGLRSGGDGYLTKPFSLKELDAHIHAQIRRAAMHSGGVLSINEHSRIVSAGGRSAKLSKREFEMFLLLYNSSGRLFSSRELYRSIWGSDMDFDANIIAVYVARLRKRLEPLVPFIGEITTFPKQGYRFKMPNEL